MNHRTIALPGLALGIACMTGCHAAGPGVGPQTVPVPNRDMAVSPMLDTLTSRLVGLELNRATLSAEYTAKHPEMVRADRDIAIIHQLLSELPNAPTGEHYANARVLRALEERLAGLAVDRKLSLAEHTPSSSRVGAMNALVASLERRRDQLRAMRP